jgi:hypothetical protein
MKNHTLAEIQSMVKAPKGQFNSFGKYKYRSAEDILESVKPVINPMGFHIILTDEPIIVGDRNYIRATVTLSNGDQSYSASAVAREDESKKGMDSAQVSGTSSSYARKYALNGLFALDDTKDSDATNKNTNVLDKDTLNEWQMLINDCESIEYLRNLHSENLETIKKFTELQSMFTKRKSELTNG